MYEAAAILAAVVLLYSIGAGRVGRSWLSGPIIFTATGLILGPAGFNALRLPLTAANLRTLVELSLAMVLFSDAAHADLRVARRTLGLPGRLLLIGLPLTIVLGTLVGLPVFRRLDALEVALLATLLAPTDAALGAPVVANATVPAATREALNLESGPYFARPRHWSRPRHWYGDRGKHGPAYRDDRSRGDRHRPLRRAGTDRCSGDGLAARFPARLDKPALAAYSRRRAGRALLLHRAGARWQRVHRLFHGRPAVRLSARHAHPRSAERGAQAPEKCSPCSPGWCSAARCLSGYYPR